MLLLWQWIIFALAATNAAYADGISGTYVGHGPNSAFLVQIVESSGGQLTGRYEQTVLEPTGKLDQMIASITGASDGHTVVVTIKPAELLSGSITASGTVEGSLLHLSGGGSGTKIELNVSKSDEAGYRARIADLTELARRIIEARAQADQLASLNKLTKDMLSYSAEADAQLAKFPAIEERYRRITEWMNAALARQRSIYGAGQASVARSQVGVAINQASIETEQLHGSLQGAKQDIGTKIQPWIKDIADFDQRCKSAALQQDADVRDGCVKFFESVKKFKQSMGALGRAFDQAEKVWIEEHGKQQGIIQASDVASR